VPLPVAQRLDGLQTGILRAARAPPASPRRTAPRRTATRAATSTATRRRWWPARDRKVVPILLVLAVIVVGVVLIVSQEDEQGYEVRAIFDNAGFVIPGEDVKIAGVKVGKVLLARRHRTTSRPPSCSTSPSPATRLPRDASCIVRPQNLIGERFVECKPTQVRSATAEAPPS
jgi:ABC-type transporter Mla subunit MlaD